VDGFWEPFQYEFFRNGVLVATLAGALCGLVGTFVVLRRMSYIGHGLSHAVFGGAAVAAVVGVNFFLGAGLWGVGSALLIGRVAGRRIIGSDAAIGVVTTASFALGLALFGLYGQARRSTEALLFGSVLGVDHTDIAVVAGVAVLTLLVVAIGYRALLFSTFDPEVAEVTGLRVDRIDALLMVVLAVVILATTQVIGAILVAAILVIPASVARMLTDRFARMLWLSTVIGAACGFSGMVASYHLDVSSGAAVVLVGAALFAVVFVATGRGARHRVGPGQVS
jgi:manganese/iron transport system permease protein/iron/zinc/copper transport system permease protein